MHTHEIVKRRYNPRGTMDVAKSRKSKATAKARSTLAAHPDPPRPCRKHIAIERPTVLAAPLTAAYQPPTRLLGPPKKRKKRRRDHEP